ncbi:MAG: FAD-dependent oxidoreductase, partial [Aliihoeflea sp.]
TSQRTAQAVHHVRLVTAGTLLEGQPHGMRQKVRELFETRGIALMENVEIAKIGASEIVSADGEHYPSDATILATGPVPQGWLARTGLDLVDGSIAIGPTLQSISDPDIFATGDCATLVERPQLKSGVSAVRAGAILAQNLRLRAENQQLRMWRPPARQLMLLTTGDQRAFASWGAFWWAGKWVWRLKRRIDRRWVRRFTIFS